jgi:hypothetical protein
MHDLTDTTRSIEFAEDTRQALAKLELAVTSGDDDRDLWTLCLYHGSVACAQLGVQVSRC